MKKPVIPVVVSQYGKFELTLQCLESLRAQKDVEVVIWLLDVCSPNRTPEKLAQLASLADRHTFLEENLGFAAANNVVIKEILKEKYECFFILNNDTLLETDALSKLYASLERHPTAAQVCPLLFYGNGTVQGAGGTIKPVLFEPGMIGNQAKESVAYTEERIVTFASGCAVLVRTAAVKKAGLIPEDYFMYSEDVDWSLQCTQAGFEVWYCPSSHITHFESVASGNYSAFKGYYVVRSNVLLARKWLKDHEYGIFTKAMRAKLLRQSIKYARYPSYVQGMWRGFKDGLRRTAVPVD